MGGGRDPADCPGCRQHGPRGRKLVPRERRAADGDEVRRHDAAAGPAHHRDRHLRRRAPRHPRCARALHRPHPRRSRDHRYRRRAGAPADARQLLRGDLRPLRGCHQRGRLHRAGQRPRRVRDGRRLAQHQDKDLAVQPRHHPQLGDGGARHHELQPAHPRHGRHGDVRRQLFQRPHAGGAHRGGGRPAGDRRGERRRLQHAAVLRVQRLRRLQHRLLDLPPGGGPVGELHRHQRAGEAAARAVQGRGHRDQLPGPQDRLRGPRAPPPPPGQAAP